VIQKLPALLKAAARARKRAYAPYSGYEVGAAILARGRIFAAGNVENSSYPLSVCAERNAVAMMIAGGGRKIDAVAIVGGRDRPAAPCGGCRQVLAEFAPPDTPVVYASPDGKKSVTTTVGALLPAAFGPVDLIRAGAESRGRKGPQGIAGIARSAARVRGTRSSGRRGSP
jgi:cytidine deaminase